MLAEYFSIVTDVGVAKVAAAQVSGVTVKIANFAVGDGSDDPVASQTDLQNETYRAPVNNLRVVPSAPNILEAECNIPPEISGFTVREIGLFDEDGDLIAVSKYQPTEKLDIASGASLDMLIKPQLIFSSVEALEAVIDPAIVMATRQFVDDQVGISLLMTASSLVSSAVLRLRNWAKDRQSYFDDLQKLTEETEIVAINTTQIVGAFEYLKNAYHSVLISPLAGLNDNDVTHQWTYFVPFVPKADIAVNSIAYAVNLAKPDGDVHVGIYSADGNRLTTGVHVAGTDPVAGVGIGVDVPLHTLKSGQLYFIALWSALDGVVGEWVLTDNSVIDTASSLPTIHLGNQLLADTRIVYRASAIGLTELPETVDVLSLTRWARAPYLTIRKAA